MPGPKHEKVWFAAISRAVHRESNGKGSPQWLDVIADKVVSLAAEGNPQAFKEVADRLDGKSKIQAEVSGPNGVALITEVRHLIVDPPMRLEE